MLCCGVPCCGMPVAGYGLAQRLLVMVDAACSPVGGDPFAALAPDVPGMAALTASVSGDGVGSTVCGSSCSWQGCMERLRLAQEGLLLLRALVATPGDVGECVAVKQAGLLAELGVQELMGWPAQAAWPCVREASIAAWPSVLAASNPFMWLHCCSEARGIPKARCSGVVCKLRAA